MTMPKIGDRLVVTAWAVREEVRCRANEPAWCLDGEDLITTPTQIGLIWVPACLANPFVCVCVGWVTKQDGLLDLTTAHHRFSHRSAMRFPRVVTKPNSKILLAYTWRTFK